MVGGGGHVSQTHAHAQQHFVGQARVHTRPQLQLPTLTLGVLGAQTVWSMDMAFAPPYLLDLGLSKSAMAAVFLAGPLSGLIVQPLIGNLADNSTSKYGRRRPFLAASALITAVGILMLGFAREIAGWFTTSKSDAHQNLAIFIGIVSVYLVDFSVNAVTALDRALMVDVAAVEDQAQANAWAARLCGIGAVLSFLIGNQDLPSITPSIFGKTQIQIISTLVTLILLVTHGIVLWLVEEQVLVSRPAGARSSSAPSPKQGLVAIFRDLYSQARTLPQPILEIFKIQLFAQIGWFPVLFYSTVWVGEIYKADVRASTPPGGQGGLSDHDLFEQATRVGSRAFFWHAILSLLTSIILPLVVPNPVEDRITSTAGPTSSPLLKRLRSMRENWPELPFWWVFSQFVFFIAMMGTWLAGLTQSVFLATLVIASVGFCFAVANWVPFSLLGILIQTQDHVPVPVDPASGQNQSAARRDEQETDEVTMSLLGSERRTSRSSVTSRLDRHPSSASTSRPSSANGYGGHASYDQPSAGHESDDDPEDVLSFGGGWNARDQDGDGMARSGPPTTTANTAAHAGSVLGLHNVSIVIPQFIVTGFSSLIFAIMEPAAQVMPSSSSSGPSTVSNPAPSKGQNSDALGLIFRLGGCSALIAGILAVRFVRNYRDALRG
ncbi:hypothetical protein BCV70DRAFT_197512 [Testicularia cyperi]|uniref:MFS general substrate transporter n=1 Tax=Testicularia cyperi TaxID=1882483 RepID=A0A317XZQ8_9BASI|nr:hypothetical protein BCV70DRAFT_197512 [Testicularia cyperi]